MTCCDSTTCHEDGEHLECPACGAIGAPVDAATLTALLNAHALERLAPRATRFCATDTCAVVYFDRSLEAVWTERDLSVVVHAKHPTQPDSPVCYCFGYTVGSIEQALARGEDPYADVANEVKAGRCACVLKNPKGTCCLGDVRKVEQRFRVATVTTAEGNPRWQ